MGIFVYRCKCGKEFERISSYPEKTRYCECGEHAKIQVSAHANMASEWVVNKIVRNCVKAARK